MPKSFLVKKSKFGLEETRHQANYRNRLEDNELASSLHPTLLVSPVSSELPIFVQLNNGYMRSVSEENIQSTKEEIICEGESMTSPESTQTADYSLPHNHNDYLFQPESKYGTRQYDAFVVVDGRTKKRPQANLLRQRFRCDECGKDYATSSNLSRHKQTHRSLDSQLAKKCQHCDKVYVSMPALSMHILTHSLKHVCEICGKSFSRPWLLRGHVRSHSGHKPFGCSHCGKAFADRSNLRAHMNTHSAFKKFKCQYCKKTFALKSYLNKHYESMCLK